MFYIQELKNLKSIQTKLYICYLNFNKKLRISKMNIFREHISTSVATNGMFTRDYNSVLII